MRRLWGEGEAMTPPRILVLRGSGDVERLRELAHRQLRIATGLEQDIQSQVLSAGAIAEIAFRARRHRREHDRLMAAVEAFERGKGSEQVSIDLNAEDATA